jgi:hypothetical protein
MSEHEANSEFLERLRAMLIAVSDRQMDALMRTMSKLSDRQVEALSSSWMRMSMRQSDALVAVVTSLIERIDVLAREVAALRQEQAGGERGPLQ